MNEPPDETYLTWLYNQVGNVKTRSRSKSYWTLLQQLFTTEFIWLVPNDDNRVQDGKDLRYQFLSEIDIDVPEEWMEEGCSVLEMLIALSRRMAFEADGRPDVWFWHFLGNLQLDGYNDSIPEFTQKVDEILQRLIWRTYDSDGRGGLFPLRRPVQDQRDVELWYQLCAYILENE